MKRIEKRLNRFLMQFIRDGHLSLKKKLFDIVMQIYGHEGLIEKNELADTAHCYVFHIDFTRLNSFSWKNIAYRKLFNPFKHIEFLLVFSLEMVLYSIHRPMVLLTQALLNNKNYLLMNDSYKLALLFHGLWYLSGAIGVISIFTLNLSVNIITGVARRFLAPVRYTVRPLLEMADLYPKSLLLLAMGTAVLTTMAFTGGLPMLVLGSQWLAFSLASKIAIVGLAATTAHSFLIKGFNVACDLVDAYKKKTMRMKNYATFNEYARKERNRKDGQTIHIMKVKEQPKIEDVTSYLSHNLSFIPLLIVSSESRRMWLCDAHTLKELTFNDGILQYLSYHTEEHSEFNQAYLLHKSSEYLFRKSRNLNTESIFRQIKKEGLLDLRGSGSTKKMTALLHRMPVDKVELRLPQEEECLHQVALFFGAERVYDYFFSNKKQNETSKRNLDQNYTQHSTNRI